MKKYILFDNDGVLVETEFWYYMATKEALEALGISLPRDLYLKNMAMGISSWDLARAAEIPEPEVERGRNLRNRLYQEYLVNKDIEIEGVLPTLADLGTVYRMGIVTTSRREDFHLIHQNRGILDYMEFCLTVEDYERSKPHPDPYNSGLRRFGASTGEVVVVEDSERGLKSAVAAGIDCIIVANDFTATHDFTSATRKVESFSELPSAIESLSN